jgi:CxxC motif-containing protein (DUF1111 family)
LYSDLLLHDMGRALGDTDGYGVFVGAAAGAQNAPAPGPGNAPRTEASGATAQEWRTAPLWGLKDSAPYLHDGRAPTIDRAITLHGGQAADAAHKYAQLSAHRKQQLDAFLTSLAAPARQEAR